MDFWIFSFLVDFLFWGVWQIWLGWLGWQLGEPDWQLGELGEPSEADCITPSIKILSKNPSRQA